MLWPGEGSMTSKGAIKRHFRAVLVTIAWLATCGDALVNPQMPPPGGSPAFDDGYVDGCFTGFQDAGRDGYQQAGRKDQARYLSMADYRAGYDQGYHACFEEEKRNPKMIGGGGHSRH